MTTITLRATMDSAIAADIEQWGFALWTDDTGTLMNGDRNFTDGDLATMRMNARDAGYTERRLRNAFQAWVLKLAYGPKRTVTGAA